MNSQIDPNKHLDKNQVFIDTKRESREFFDAFAKPDNVKLIIDTYFTSCFWVRQAPVRRKHSCL